MLDKSSGGNMKKIVNILILIVVCLLPTVVVNAEGEFNLEWKVLDKIFLYEEDGIYYFVDEELYNLENVKLYVYDDDGNKISEEPFYDSDEMTEDEFYHTEEYARLISYWNYEDDYDNFFDKESKYYYEVYYDNEMIYGYDEKNDIEFSFSENINLTKKILGERYDVYQSIKSKEFYITGIDIFDSVNVVYYRDDDYDTHAYIMDKDNNFIMDYKSEAYQYFIYEKDGIIYFPEYTNNINAFNKITSYKLDGTKIGTYVIDSNYFDEEYYGYCGNYNLVRIDIDNNRMLLIYSFRGCPVRREMTSVEDYAKDRAGYPYVFTLNYSLDYEVETVNSSNGEITYETKVDEDGKSYVELKVTPKDGYSVEKIIVTDSNGKIIEVTDNKFYMPMNDVKIEVKYVQGEYLPIPDTFLGKSFTVIIIGLILVGLGFYTINYVKGDSKVDI